MAQLDAMGRIYNHSTLNLEQPTRSRGIRSTPLGRTPRLDACQAAEKTNGPRDLRFRMEHADYLNPQDIPRFHQLSVIASMQPSLCCNAGELGRTKIQMAARSVGREEGNSTREVLREVTPLGPAGKIQVDQPQENLSIEQSVVAYTRYAAYANFTEKSAGALEADKFADAVYRAISFRRRLTPRSFSFLLTLRFS